MKINERDQRRLATDGHRAAVLEKAKENPEVFVNGLLFNPEITVGLKDVEEVFSTLLAMGQKEALEALLRHPRLPKRVQSALASALLLG